MDTRGVDEAWFERIRGGDEEAWEALVTRYEGLVYAVPRRLGLSDADAAEVCQGTWLTLHRHAALIQKPRSLVSWILTAAARECSRVRRQETRRGDALAAAGAAEESSETASPEEVAERLERIAAVRAAVEDLEPRCRDLLRLLYLDSVQRSYDEVAAVLGRPRGSLGPTRRRCLARLAEALAQEGVVPGE